MNKFNGNKFLGITKDTISETIAEFSEKEFVLIFAYMFSTYGITLKHYLEKIEFFKDISISEREFDSLVQFYNNPT